MTDLSNMNMNMLNTVAKTITISRNRENTTNAGNSAEQVIQYYSQDASEKRDSAQPTLLFLHGILGDGRTWLPHFPAFDTFDKIAITQSGFGSDFGINSADDALFDTQKHADELLAFCEALNHKENRPDRTFIIIAWSYACHVALLAAKKHLAQSASQLKPLIDSLLLYELIVPSYGITETAQTAFTKDITVMMSPIIKATRRRKTDVAIDHFIGTCKNAPFTLNEQSAYVQAIKNDNAHTLEKLLTQVEPAPISAAELQAIHAKMPITIMMGENSRDIFRLSSEAGANAIGEEVRIIAGVDHLLPEENPALFAQIMKDAL